MADPRKIARPKTVNEVILNRSIRHGIYLTRLAGGEANWLKEQMPALRREVSKEITPLLADLDPKQVLTEADERLIQETATRGSEVARQHLERLSGESISRLGQIALNEADFERRLFQKAIPINMNFAAPSDQFLLSMMETEPISGKTMRGWFSEMTTQTRTALNDQIRQGMIEGESINDILRRVRGRRENGFNDGVIGRVGDNAEAIVRSGVMKASNKARQEFHQANPDVVKGYSWVLTLDSRTCSICSHGESQNPYPPDSPPDLPAHVNCRCLSTVITPSFRELGLDIDEMEPGTRASMNGEVPDTMTYEQWFDEQSESLQRDILGDTRLQGYKAGYRVTAFADNGQILNLDQLRAKEPDLFSSTFSQVGPRVTSIDEHRRQMEAFAATLSQEQRLAVQKYTGSTYIPINDALRAGRNVPDKHLDTYNKINEVMAKAPRYQGDVWRGLDEIGFKSMANYQKNQYITMNAYTSASLNKMVAEEFVGTHNRVLLNIKGKNGVLIENLSGISREREVLFKPASKFKVLNRRMSDDRTLFMTLEEV